MSAIVDDELVEMVARAMCEAWHYAPIRTPDGNAEWCRTQTQYRKQARAALAVAVPIVADKCHAVAMGYARERRASAEEVTDSRVQCDLKRDAAAATVVAIRIRSLSTETKP